MIEQHVPAVEFRPPAINERPQVAPEPEPLCAVEEESGAGTRWAMTTSGPCILNLRKGGKPHRGEHMDQTGHRW